MKTYIASILLAAGLGVSTIAMAASLKGTVIDGTTEKPAGRENVVLIALAQGMTEVAHGRTDAAGRFSLSFADSSAPHLLRVMHEGVTYHQLVPRAVNAVEVRVYDTARRLEGITISSDVQYLEGDSDTLQVSELITVRNASQPPRTRIGDPFEIGLPADAQLEAGLVRHAGAPPLKYMPAPGERRGQYYFRFPLRPGETRFAVSYRLPYRGEAVIEPKILYPLERFVVTLPTSMKFEAQTTGMFQPTDVNGVEGKMFAAAAVSAGQPLSFRVSGTGKLAALRRSQQPSRADETARPGGGLGPPSDSPDPLDSQRWWILGGLVLMLTIGGVYVGRPITATRSRLKRKTTSVKGR